MANWDNISSRGSVDDRRGNRGLLIGGGGLSLTGLALILLVNYFTGVDLTNVVTDVGTNASVNQEATGEYAGKDSYETFASTVLGSTNDAWTKIFSDLHKTYTAPTLVLFRGATQSGCGTATSDVGPHYCPLDDTIYLDETFFDELQNRFGAGNADVAQAYVIAHEAGHHVQNQLGALDQVANEAEANPDLANALSVQEELQADCYAGIWAYSLKGENVFQPGEIQEAIDAAGAVGDDRIQAKTTGRINPETWTHGSGAARVAAFTKGYESGNMANCKAF
jgi:predicted metalloprotease